ncbi:MAG: cytochrome P450 [Novosphingobium sp.]
MTSPAPADPVDFATPAGGGGAIALLLKSRLLAWWAARLLAWLGRRIGHPLSLKGTVLVIRHADAREVLDRDLDFLVGPVNGPRMDGIGFHFILGMDRSPALITEREVLYQALRRVDMGALVTRAHADADARLVACGGSIDVVEDYAREVAAGTASALFGIAPEDGARFRDAARAIFYQCFLNLAGDKAVEQRGRAAAKALTGWLDTEIARRTAAGEPGDDMMGQLLHAGASADLTRRTLGGMLVGSIDTTASAVAKIMTVLMRDPVMRAAATRNADERYLMYGWCLEALRRWAHVPMLGRQAARDCTLAGVPIKAGAKVILLSQAAMLDPDAFPSPTEMHATRPLAGYLHFGAGLHPCAGRDVNQWQIPMLVGALLKRRPTAMGKMAWAGPFPAHLPLTLGGDGT